MVTANEEDGNVVFRTSGSLNVAGLGTSNRVQGATGFVAPTVTGGTTNGSFVLGPNDPVGNAKIDQYLFGVDTWLPTFGGGGLVQGDNGTGLPFGTGLGLLVLPPGYDGSTELNATLTFFGKTFAELGITPGTTAIAKLVNGETITLEIGVPTAVIPLPAALPLLATGLIGLAAVARRRRR
ncbi:MAG: VPLPA-CTERM sorting domain-containing protein [Pseudomonadota bacterium]